MTCSPDPRFQAAPRSLHRDLLAVDIAGFGDRARDNMIQLHMRDALYRILRQAFDDAGIGWHSCSHEDQGDGVLVVVSPHVPTSALIDPLADLIRAGVRCHNRLSSPAAAIQLRMAIHAGQVHQDPNGLAGEAVVHLCRLLDAGQLRTALAASGAELALIVSAYVHDTVIRHGPGLIDPAEYHPIEVAVKETRARAWVNILGRRRTEVTAAAAGHLMGKSRQPLPQPLPQPTAQPFLGSPR